MFGKYLREIKDDEMKKWYPHKQSVAIAIIEDFLDSDMKMAEVNLESLPEVEPKEGASPKSTKQDSFASSFYAWKKKKSIKNRLAQNNINIILIRRQEKIALKKKDVVNKK